MKRCVFWKRSCAFALALLGVSAYARDLPDVKIVEGFELQDSEVCVYGGAANRLRTKIYGMVGDGQKKKMLAGIKIALYDGTTEIACTYTQENGEFYFDEVSLWAGLSVTYTMIVSDPKSIYAPEKRDLLFDFGEVTREEFVALKRKKE